MQLALLLFAVLLCGANVKEARPVLEELDGDAAEIFRQADEIDLLLKGFAATSGDFSGGGFAEDKSGREGDGGRCLDCIANIADADIKRALSGYVSSPAQA